MVVTDSSRLAVLHYQYRTKRDVVLERRTDLLIAAGGHTFVCPACVSLVAWCQR